jgi:hypothetical protein
MATHQFTLAPFRGRGQGEGACQARTSASNASKFMQFTSPVLKHRVLRRPLTPTLSPGGGEGVVYGFGAANG